VLNGLLDDVPAPPSEAANFSYYTHQLLGVSGVFPLGGPHKGNP
jgi:hypothetical protein